MQTEWAPDWRTTRWIAHRCGGRLAPENSLAGLRAAAAAGYRAVEFDVMLSAEASPWVIHDDSLARTAFASGEVGRMSDAELGLIDISRGQPARFRGERLPRLAQVLGLCGELRLAPNLEIKPYPGQDAATGERAGRDAAASSLPIESILLSSFSLEALAAARRAAPALRCAVLFEQVPGDWRQHVESLAAVAIHCDHEQRDWSWLPPAKSLGLAVRAYTVNDARRAAELFAMGVDAVFTDALGTLGPD